MPTLKETLVKKYGNVIFDGLDILNEKREVFSISPSIDFGLGGGLPEGNWIGFAGPPGCGKTTTALQLLANMQEEKYNINKKKRKIFIIDIEHRLKSLNMAGVQNLNPNDKDNIQVIRSNTGAILSGEEILDIVELICKDTDNIGCGIMIDSVSSICPAVEIASEMRGDLRATQPKLLAHFCRKMAPIVPVAKATMIFIQHLINNTSGYGEKLLTDGGVKLQYQFSAQLVSKGKPEAFVNDDGARVGQIIEWDIRKAPMREAGLKVRSYLKYGYGLDRNMEIVEIGKELGVIQQKGAWFYFGESKFNGQMKVLTALENDPQMVQEVLAKIKSMT